MRNHSSTECMLKEKILILSYKHVIFLLGKVQQPFALGIIAVMCFDIFHIIFSVLNVLWFYGVTPMCCITNPAQHHSITPYNHNTFKTQILQNTS